MLWVCFEMWISPWDVRGLGTENNFKQEEAMLKMEFLRMAFEVA